ncbi:MAG: hypothetical protein JWN48_2544 [Myxococcaceae bacterium]|nr:hypothetical protein [Myxococcaceae bacterium]
MRSPLFKSAGLLLLGMTLAPGLAEAHHSFSMYDSTQLLKLEGTVKEFQWTNPHVMMWLTKTSDPVGEVWTIELPTSPGNLARMNWSKRSLKPGDHVVVELNPLRDGQYGGSFKKATLVDTGVVLIASAPAGADSADGGASGTVGDHDAAPDQSDQHDETDAGSRATPAAGGCACELGPGAVAANLSSGWFALLGLAWLACRRRVR